MKQFFIALCMLFGIVGVSPAQEEEKTALLITHYGSSDEQTIALTLDVITREAKERFPQFEVREAYISPIVRRRLAKLGKQKDSPIDALLKLRTEGYTHVLIQSTTLIEGSEMTSVRKDAERVKEFFKEVRVGNPLLYSVADAELVINILTNERPGSKEDIVYVGHGNQLPSTATYAMLDYMMKQRGLKNCHVSTIEGYPSLETTKIQLKGTRPKKVILIPLLLVCGNHSKEDIAGVWKDELEKEGYQVEVRMRGLGELPAIREMYMEHVRNLLD
ncbi:MAG: sirohydrochlorin cobaltochelatase [Tannerella sp.]|nr:sirohydrochlorin cobaltochelatase [Tannerella sp.]